MSAQSLAPAPMLLREVTMDGKTHQLHPEMQLIDPLTVPYIDYHTDDYHYPLWNTIDDPDDHAHVYRHTVGEAIAIMISPPPVKPLHGPVQMMKAWKHACNNREEHDAAMAAPSSELAIIFRDVYDEKQLALLVGHRHVPMRSKDAATRWLQPIEREITTQLTLPPDWDTVVRTCAIRMLNHQYSGDTSIATHDTPSSSSLTAAVAAAFALVLPMPLRLIVADYCVPLVHIGRYYEKDRRDWKSCFPAYHQAMVYDYHPFATFKAGFALMWGMDATPVRWTRARDVYRFGVALGSDQSISQLGAAYSCGYGVKENQKTAVELLKHSRDPFSYCSYGYRLTEPSSDAKQHNLPQNIPLGITLMTATMCVAVPRLAQRDARTLAQMANWLDFGLDHFLAKDEKKALEYYLAAGDYGDTQCLFYAALSNRNGQGCAKDDGAAMRLFRRAAVQQNPEAQCGLAQSILQHTTYQREIINASMETDHERNKSLVQLLAPLDAAEYEAMTLMRHAAEGGLTTALYAIAYWYAFGYRRNVRTHPPPAVTASDAAAATALPSHHHHDGNDDDDDVKVAVVKDAIELDCVGHLPPLPGDALAEYEYQRSRSKAMIWAQRAIDMGDVDARVLMENLMNMTDDQQIIRPRHLRRGSEDRHPGDDDNDEDFEMTDDGDDEGDEVGEMNGDDE